MTNRIATAVTTNVSTTNVNIAANKAFVMPPSNNLVIHGRKPPVGDTFDPKKTLYPSSLVISNNRFLHYHAIVWSKMFGQDTRDYGCVFSDDDGLRLCFNSKTSLMKFERWFERYKRIFFPDGTIESCYAPFPSTGRLSGYFIEDDIRYNDTPLTTGMFANSRTTDTISESFLPDWVTIVRHARKPVLRLNNGWFFTSPNDGVMFKMLRS